MKKKMLTTALFAVVLAVFGLISPSTSVAAGPCLKGYGNNGIVCFSCNPCEAWNLCCPSCPVCRQT